MGRDPVFLFSDSPGCRWWTCSICWWDTFALHIRVHQMSWELLEFSFGVIQQLVLNLKTSGLFGGGQFATASMRPNAHTHRPRFDGGFVFHTMMTSSARKIVWVQGRARTESSMRSRMDFSISFHGGFANLRGLLKTCIRRCKITDGVRPADVVTGQVRGKTVSNPEHVECVGSAR